MHFCSVSASHYRNDPNFVAPAPERHLRLAESRGRIEQVGSPDEVYSNPATSFVYRFLGKVNVFHSRLRGPWAEVEREAGAENSTAFVRPHDIEILREAVGDALPANVLHVQAIGPVVRVELTHQGEVIEVELARERQQKLVLAAGEQVWLLPRQVTVFDGSEEPRRWTPDWVI